jgi:hypothetical protein
MPRTRPGCELAAFFSTLCNWSRYLVKKTLLDPRIDRFCGLVTTGIESWTEAGVLLCQIKADNANAYELILERNSWLTRDVLETFERIGAKQIYPYLLVDGSPGAVRLAAFPFDEQAKLYRGTVLVAVRSGRSTISVSPKRVSELTFGECARVFDGGRVRTPNEQREILRRSGRVVKSGKAVGPDAAENDELIAARLEADPKGELQRMLEMANNAMLEARSALSIINRGSKHDALISAALSAIGELRFIAKNGDLKSVA